MARRTMAAAMTGRALLLVAAAVIYVGCVVVWIRSRP